MKRSKKIYTLLTLLFIVVFAMACAFIFACGKNKETGDDNKTEEEQTQTGGDEDDGSGENPGGSTEPGEGTGSGEKPGGDDGSGENPGGDENPGGTPETHSHAYEYVESSDESNPNYSWTETDDGWACTVTLTCTTDDGTECTAPTTTAEATVTSDTSQGSQKAATCTEDGYTTYRATYGGQIIATKQVTIDKLGHDYTGVTPTWNWPVVSAAESTVDVTMSMTCTRCGDVWTSEPVTATYVGATATEDAKYTVTVTGPDGQPYTDTQLAADVLLPSVEVDFSDGSTYAWIDDFVLGENNEPTGTLTDGKTFPNGILSLTTSGSSTSSKMTIVAAGGTGKGYLQTGGETQNGEKYFTIDLSKYVGYNVSVSVEFGGTGSNQSKYMLLGTSSTANTASDSSLLAIAFSNGVSDVQKLEYVMTITEDCKTLYITWNDDLRIYGVEASVSEDATPTPAVSSVTLTSNKTGNKMDTSDSDPTATLTMSVTMAGSDPAYTGKYTVTVTQTPETAGKTVANVTDNGDGTFTVTAVSAGTVTTTLQLWDAPLKAASVTMTVTQPDPLVDTWEASNVTVSFGVSGPGVSTTADIKLVFTKTGGFTMTISNVDTTISGVADNYETFKTYYGADADGSISVSEFIWNGDYATGYTFVGEVSEGSMSGDVSAAVEGDLLRFQYDQVQHLDANVAGHTYTEDLMISFGTVSFCREGSTYVVEDVAISQTAITLNKNGGTATLTATVTMARGEYSDDYEWDILEGGDVVSVSGTGASVTITALKAGVATVQLTAGGKTLTCEVTVVAVTNVSLAIGEEDELKIINQTATLTATVTVEEGTDAYAGGYKWATSDSSVLSVSKSSTSSPTNYITLTVKGAGTATITVTLDDGSQGTYSVTIQEHNHSYTITSWTWNDDNTCTVTASCGNSDGLCYAVDITASATVTSEYFEATCEAAGYTEYTAKYTPDGGTEQTYDQKKTVIDPDAPAFGHSYETKYLTTADGVDADGWYLVCATCEDTVKVMTGYGWTFEAMDLDQFNAALACEGATIILGFDITSAVTISAGQNVTIDLNGRTITAGANGENTLTVETGAAVTVTDSKGTGAIKNVYTGTTSTDNAAAIFTTGTLVIEGGSVESTSVGIRAQGGEVTINGGQIITTYFTIWEDKGVVTVTINDGVIKGENKGIFVSGDSNFGYADKSWQEGAVTKLIVNDGTISSKYDSAICTLGYTSAESAYIEINGGTIYSEYRDDTTAGSGDSSTRIPAIYLANGTLVVTGGDISGATALEVRGGYVTITGGTFNTTAQATNTPAYQGSGATSYGYALAIYPFGNANGRLTGSANGTADESFDWSTNVVISGGTFNGGLYATTDTYTKGGVTYDIGYTLEISGGCFTDDPTPYLAAGYTASAPTMNGTDYYIVSLTTVTVDTYDALVAALGTSAEIVLNADISGTVAVKAGTEVVIDLNGHSITYDGEDMATMDGADYKTAYTIVVEEGASLTIKDGTSGTADSEDGTGSVVMSYDKDTAGYTDAKYARRFAAIKSEGTLIIESGYIKSSSVGIVVEGSETRTVGGVVTGGYLYVHGGYIDAAEYSIFEGAGENVVVYIDGGYVSGGRGICVDGDAYFGYDSDSGTRNWQNGAMTTLNVYDGATIVSPSRSAISTIGYANATSTYVNIYGGTIKGEDLTSSNEVLNNSTDFATVYIPNGNLAIYGGEITGTYALSIMGGTAKIYGGTFTSTGMGAYDQVGNPDKPAAYAISVVFNGPLSPSGRTSVDNALDVAVCGGTFTGDIVWDGEKATDTCAADFAVSGGYFSANPSDYLGEGLVTYKLAESETEDEGLVGYYTVAQGAAIVVDDLVADGTLPTITSGTSINISASTVIYRGNGTKMTVMTTGSSNAGVRNDKTSYSSSDDVSFTNAIYFSGTMATNSKCIKLEVTGACEVVFYGLTSSSNKTFKLTGEDSVDDVKDSCKTEKSNTMYEFHMHLDEAGTYLLGADGANWIFALTVAYDEETEPEEPQEETAAAGTGLITIGYLIDKGLISLEEDIDGDLSATLSSELVIYNADGTAITFVPGSGKSTGFSVQETSQGYEEDGLTFSYGAATGGAGSSSANSIKIEVAGACTLTVYVTGKSNNSVGLYDSEYSGTAIKSESTTSTSTVVKFTVDISEAGTYYFGGTAAITIYGIEIAYE